MSNSLQKLLRTGRLAAACSIALVLGACGGDDGGAPPTNAAPTTASALAVSQIDAQTCDSNDPQSVNGLSLNEDENQTDVTMLAPACSTH